MESMECTAQAAVRKHRPTTRKPSVVKDEIPKTPANELISVDEYFGILHKMVDEYYDSIQG